MTDQLKALVMVILGAVLALGIALGGGLVLAEEEHEENHEHEAGEFEVSFSSSPRFPVAGEEADFTLLVSHDGTPEEGLAVTITLAKVEVEDHHGGGDQPHDEAEANHDDEAEADHPHDEAEANHDDEAGNTEAESVSVAAIEMAPGVYVVKYTLEESGKYLLTPSIGSEHTEFEIAVRSSPIAWPFVIGLAGASALLAGVVAAVKTVRRKW